jgi:lipopolysaccharide assembly outer membrane protein LptD (OstA)
MKSKIEILLLWIIIFYSMQSVVFPQQQDSLFVIPDSLSTEPDSLQVVKPQGKTYDVDTTVFASSKDSLIFFVKEKKMKIYGEGNINYKQTEITSANIFIDFNSNYVDAVGIPSDTAKNKLIGAPVLKEGAEVYEGQKMKYNFKTGQGLISFAETEQDGSKYTGEKIKKVDKETYFIEDGIFTTCDDEECPHYHFTASKMKVIHKEQLIAEWIFLNFGGVPLPIPLPFAVFPIESGRRSGIIIPAFGQSGIYGTYFTKFGYFWAMSDYMDLTFDADYYTRGSFDLRSRYRYVKKYDYTGNVQLGYKFRMNGESSDAGYSESKDWSIRINHNQQITPTLKLDGNLNFTTSSYLSKNEMNLNEAITDNVYSSASLFKSWEESGNSLSINYSRTQELRKNTISEVLPSMTFSLAQKYPFRDNVGQQEWYETFGYSYSGQFQNNRNKNSEGLKIRGGIQHNLRASLSPKIGYFSISPNFSYNESWYNKRITKYNAVNDTGANYIQTDDVKEINMVRTFSMGVSASTKFYGMFNINTLGVNAIRHIVSPSISYSYSPDFSTDFWGYYDHYIDSTGNSVEYNKFEKEIFSKPSNQESQSISFNIGNVFEMKTNADPTDTTSKENKFQLLNLSASMGYNFAGKSYKLSDLNMSYRTQVGSLFSFSGSSTFSPYDYDEKGRIDRYMISNGKGLLRLTNFSFSTSFSISGDRIKSSETDERTTTQQDQYLQSAERNTYRGIYNDKDADFSIPWDLSLNYNFNESRLIPTNIRTNSNLSGSINFNLTPKWKFSVSGSYDLKNKEFSAPQVRISRDLHCWVMNFTWNPIGTFRGYTFEIRVKAPQLQDLKITKQDQFYEGR